MKVSFGDENTYGQWITVLNLTLLNKYRRYALADYDFYLFTNEPPIPDLANDLPVYTDIYSSDTYTGSSITHWDIIWWQTEARFQALEYEIKDNTLLCTGFLVLIVIPFSIHLFMRKKMKSLKVIQ